MLWIQKQADEANPALIGLGGGHREEGFAWALLGAGSNCWRKTPLGPWRHRGNPQARARSVRLGPGEGAVLPAASAGMEQPERRVLTAKEERWHREPCHRELGREKVLKDISLQENWGRRHRLHFRTTYK